MTGGWLSHRPACPRGSVLSASGPTPPILPHQGGGAVLWMWHHLAHEWRETSPSDGGGRRGWSHGLDASNRPNLSPYPNPPAYSLHRSTRRPAGEQWWGGPGGGFASPTGSRAAATGRASPSAYSAPFQKPAPRGGFRLMFLLTSRRKPSRGPHLLFYRSVCAGRSLAMRGCC